jgi:hypothetical protein
MELISTLDKEIYYLQRNIFTGHNKITIYNCYVQTRPESSRSRCCDVRQITRTVILCILFFKKKHGKLCFLRTLPEDVFAVRKGGAVRGRNHLLETYARAKAAETWKVSEKIFLGSILFIRFGRNLQRPILNFAPRG